MDSININSRHDRFLLTALFIILFLIFHSPVRAQSWGDIDYDGAPWVDNVSIRLPLVTSALNTTFRPRPLGET